MRQRQIDAISQDAAAFELRRYREGQQPKHSWVSAAVLDGALAWRLWRDSSGETYMVTDFYSPAVGNFSQVASIRPRRVLQSVSQT